MKRIWKPVKEYEGYYEVSSDGLVRSLERTVTFKNGSARKIVGRMLIQGYTRKGYLHVSLCKDCKGKGKMAHRLVAGSFIDNPNNHPQINHMDCNKENNNVSNLEWCTAQHNIRHSFSNGLEHIPDCENSWKSKLTNKEVRRIKMGIGIGIMGKELADIYGVVPATISAIKKELSWKRLKLKVV